MGLVSHVKPGAGLRPREVISYNRKPASSINFPICAEACVTAVLIAASGTVAPHTGIKGLNIL